MSDHPPSARNSTGRTGETLAGSARLRALLAADPFRQRILDLVRTLALPDCWVGAGFLRNAVWDHLHGRPAAPLARGGDVDVVWFDPARADPGADRMYEARLRERDPSIAWSVKNQARMHLRNGDAAYGSTEDAMRCWPETATAIAARRTDQGGIAFVAPFGFDDLFNLLVRPTPRFAEEKHHIFVERVRRKDWLRTWPKLRIAPAEQDRSRSSHAPA